MIRDRIRELSILFEQEKIDGYIIPTTDEFQNEYVPSFAKRLEYITGFDGSNGICIIFKDKGLFFTDGRYLEQSKQQLDTDFFQIFDIRDITKSLATQVTSAQTIGYDPKLFTKQVLKIFGNLTLKVIAGNLIDRIWNDRPAQPTSKVYIYPDEFAGETYESKIKSCKKLLEEHQAEALIITSPDSVCWLLNLRACDIEFTPLMLARTIILADEIYLFVDTGKLDVELKMARPLINFMPGGEFEKFLNIIKGKILIDENLAPVSIINAIKNKENVADPCKLLKACKNEAEIKYAISRHIQDAVTVCEFLSCVAHGDLSALTEYEFGEKLTALRKEQQGYKSDSFPVICGFRENGAIIHYRACKKTAKKIQGNGLLLIDSGGQYLGCTTDITRTVAIGSPSAEERRHYTLVLQGHIELAKAKFPRGTSGANLEALARKFLWAENLDYPHSTGHGVGSYLSVHEGPQGINMKNTTALQEGMILSNEPGYYVPGRFGIRIENLMYVKKSDHPNYLQFENLTLVPYAKELINLEMFDKHQLEYLKQYYQNIRSSVCNSLSHRAKEWFDQQTAI